jgi:hypothetical protein
MHGRSDGSAVIAAVVIVAGQLDVGNIAPAALTLGPATAWRVTGRWPPGVSAVDFRVAVPRNSGGGD